MTRLAQLALASQIVLIGSSALANPMTSQVLRVREVAGGHVQLTYGVDPESRKYAGKTAPTPSHEVTFGAKRTAWKELATSYGANTGSGIRGLRAMQMCDCEVPIGRKLSYSITVPYDSEYGPLTLTADLTTSGTYDSSVISPGELDAGPLFPWSIPEPMEVQGIECAAECSHGRPPASFRRCGTCATGEGSGPAGLLGLVIAAGFVWRLVHPRRRERRGSCARPS